MRRCQDFLPRTYDEWLDCLRNTCGRRVTPEFVASRLAILGDRDRPETRAFIEAWGEQHLHQVLAWFQALQRQWLH